MKLASLLTLTGSCATLIDALDKDDFAAISTTCLAITTLTTDVEFKSDKIIIDMVQNYIESMSEEELVALDEKLSDKNLDLDFNDDSVKVFAKKDTKKI